MKYLPQVASPTDIKKLNMQELDTLAWEVRKVLIDTVNKNGGHLSSNLGVVELSIAIHYAFSCPNDKVIFDVGHQCYTHKLLTGRFSEFSTLRQLGGISGFPKTCESKYDCFNTGHSSTSISAAMGMVAARDTLGKKHSVVSVIGDGSISNGMAFEALNNIAQLNSQLIIVLNDNEMSISKNVGALSDQLAKIRVSKKYLRFKAKFKKLLANVPIFGDDIERLLKGTRNAFKRILIKGIIFEQFGLKYLGPIDGHNIRDMVNLFNEAKKLNSPVLIHVVTQKGRGYQKAEEHPDNYHGVSPKTELENFTTHVSGELIRLAKSHENFVAITAAMAIGTGIKDLATYFPDRCYDVGICEEHAVTFAAGMAASGLKPYVCIYSTFLQRCYDQILHDVCLQNLPVTFCIDRAGLNPRDGETHHGIYDISFLNNLPNIEVFTPATYSQLSDAMNYAISANNPVAVRYPSDTEVSISLPPSDPKIWVEIDNKAAKTTILAVGSRMLRLAIEVGKIAAVNIVCVTSVKPLDYDMLGRLNNIITMEDGIKSGGFYTSVLQYYANKDIKCKIVGIGYENNIIGHGDLNGLLSSQNITASEIAKYAD